MSVDVEALPGKRLAMLWARTFQLLRGRGVNRLGWGVTDQALSSLTNLVMTLSVARTLGCRQFGAFTLAYVTYGFALTASRALSSDPLMVRFGGQMYRRGGAPPPAAAERPCVWESLEVLAC